MSDLGFVTRDVYLDAHTDLHGDRVEQGSKCRNSFVRLRRLGPDEEAYAAGSSCRNESSHELLGVSQMSLSRMVPGE